MVALSPNSKINIIEESERMEVEVEDKNKVHQREQGGGMGGCQQEVRMCMV
jgi:hypothetical protein